MFIDSHCHLSFADLGNYKEDSVKILTEARHNGICLVVDISTDIVLFKDSVSFANSQDMVYCALGVHPLHIKDNLDFQASDIKRYVGEKKVIGIGESGLDYYYDKENATKQQDFFILHAELCASNNLPLIVHTRSAEEDTLSMLRIFAKEMNIRSVIHCFSGNIAFAKSLLDLGCYISFSGVVTFKNAKELHEVAKYVPLERILIETDSPYLAPVPHRGKINKPGHVRYIGEFIGNLRDMSIIDFAKQLKNNFYSIFPRAKEQI